MRMLSRTVLALFLLLLASSAIGGDFKKGWKAYSSTDYETALSEWRDLADAGNANACYGMGLLYGNGFGVDMNDDMALKYYLAAAEKGHAEAQYALAIMHQNGWGVPIDEEEGIKWYLLAANLGDLDAKSKIEFLASRMTAEQIGESERRVDAWMKSHPGVAGSR